MRVPGMQTSAMQQRTLPHSRRLRRCPHATHATTRATALPNHPRTPLPVPATTLHPGLLPSKPLPATLTTLATLPACPHLRHHRLGVSQRLPRPRLRLPDRRQVI